MNRPAGTRLTEPLDQQVAALESVLDVLAREQSALEARDVALLERLTAEKQERLANAAGLEQQRRELAPSPSAMETLAESPAIAQRWARLLDLTRACRDHNEANGRIIRRGNPLPPFEVLGAPHRHHVETHEVHRCLGVADFAASGSSWRLGTRAVPSRSSV